MADKGIVDDPLRGGGAFDDQDMEDLTSHLAGLTGGRGSHDGLDLGDNTELLQGNLDRFRALAGDDTNDDLFTSYGGLGLGLGVSDSTIITTTNYPTYGELAAAKPPSYEDSVLYEQAPLGMHVGGAAAAAGSDDPLTAGGYGAYGNTFGGAAAAGLSTAVTSMGIGQGSDAAAAPPPLPQLPLASTGNGGGAWPEVHEAGLGPLGGAAAAPRPLPAAAVVAGVRAGGTGAQEPYPSLPGGGRQLPVSAAPPVSASAAAQARASPLDALVLPGSGELRIEDLQALSSPHLASPASKPQVGAGGRGGSGSGYRPQIIVGDPIKREQGGLFGIKGGYVTYLVKAKARPGGAGGVTSRPETSVRRRFREFVALAELLKEKYRGYFVPPRPEKNAVEGQRMADGFVEERRLALERYLNKLARHPVIGASEELRLFLEVDGELADCGPWLALRPPSLGGSVLEGTAKFSKQILGLDRAVTDPVQAAQPTKKATDFMRVLKETARSMQSAPSASSLPPDEVALMRAREEVDALQGCLATASRAAEKLVSRLDRWSVVHGELGLALLHLRNAERAEGVALANHTGTLKQSGTLMHDTERLGTALVRSSRIGRRVTGRCAIELGCLHQYLGLMPAALKGLRARDKALLTADTLQSDLEGRRKVISELEAAGAKVLGGDAARAKKVAELAGDVAVLEQSVVAARARYDKIKEINQEEMSRLRSELRSDLLSMMKHYVAIMSAGSQRNLEIWLQAAGELQASPEQLQAAKACLVGPAAEQPQPQTPQQQQPQQLLQQQPVPLSALDHHYLYQPQHHSPAAGPSQFAASFGAGVTSSLGEVDLHSSGLAAAAAARGREGYPL